MTFAIIKPSKPFNLSEVQVKEYYLEKNKLWVVNNGEFLLHYTEASDSRSFLQEIGVISYGDDVKYLQYKDEEMREIFRHYLKKGELFNVNFDGEADEYLEGEFSRLHEKIRCYGKMKTDEELKKVLTVYDDITGELLSDSPKSLRLIKGDVGVERAFKVTVSIYRNSLIMVNGIYKDIVPNMALEIYNEIFKLLNKPFSVSEVEIKEKETEAHPLKNAYKVMSAIFDVVGDDSVIRLGISEKEYQNIKNEVLKHTKEFENKKVYK